MNQFVTMPTPPADATYQRVDAARAAMHTSAHSFFCSADLVRHVKTLAAATRIPNGWLLDMALVEFLERRGVDVSGIVPHLPGKEPIA